ncbi:MAG: single-stranded DNA-binding protein [Salinivirgaceae bacterium]
MINKVILVGNVGKDPEVRHLESGVAVAQLPLATSETYKDKSGNKTTQTEWHNLVFWRGLADVVEKYVKKGDPLYIEGRIRSRSYDDKDGVKRYVTEIVVDNMQMLGRKSSGDGGGSTPPPSNSDSPDSSSVNEPLETDDLPF